MHARRYSRTCLQQASLRQSLYAFEGLSSALGVSGIDEHGSLLNPQCLLLRSRKLGETKEAKRVSVRHSWMLVALLDA